MPGGYKAENNLPLIAKTFKINIVEVFLSSLLLIHQQTNKKSGATLSLEIHQDSNSIAAGKELLPTQPCNVEIHRYWCPKHVIFITVIQL